MQGEKERGVGRKGKRSWEKRKEELGEKDRGVGRKGKRSREKRKEE